MGFFLGSRNPTFLRKGLWKTYINCILDKYFRIYMSVNQMWIKYRGIGNTAISESEVFQFWFQFHSWLYNQLNFLTSLSWAALVAQRVKNLPAMRETCVWPWIGKIPWRRKRLPTLVFWPGVCHGLYSPRGHKESDMTEWLSLTHSLTYLSFIFPIIKFISFL